MANKSKIDRLHDLMPKFFRTRVNPNWKALIEAMGERDQELADLLEEIRKQFFIKTAERPWIDRLGANVNVSRPRFVGMDDESFRKYIPTLSYQPKQVKQIMDELVNIFFFREITTSFSQSTGVEPFFLLDGWELKYTIDNQFSEEITFRTEDFTNISAATAEEIVNAINRQAKFSFAVVFDDRITKQKRVRIFTNTIGSKGSVQILGGRANLYLQFSGFYQNAGATPSTQWLVTKVGDTMTYQQTGGSSINLNQISVGDVVISTLPNNEGSFVIESIDLANASFTFTNLFGNNGTYDQALLPAHETVKFMTPSKMVVYTNSPRAIVWEVSPGEIIVEMPATPPVVRRSLKGSAHLNGLSAAVTDTPSSNSLEIADASEWPNSGQFFLQELDQIHSHILTETEDNTSILDLNTRFDAFQRYSYTGKSGNLLTSITPPLPTLAGLNEFNVATIYRDPSFECTATTTSAHGYSVGESVRLYGNSGPLSSSGIRVLVSVADSPTTVASKVATVINSYTEFNASSVAATVTITNATNGATADGSIGTFGGTLTVTQQGSPSLPEITDVICPAGSTFDVAGDGKYFSINTAGNVKAYHIWIETIDGINTQQNPSIDPIEGSFYITSTPTPTTFTFISSGESGTVNGGTSAVERIGMASAGSIVYLSSALIDTGILGPYLWDDSAAYVISSLTSNIQQEVKAGSIVRTLQIQGPNNIPDTEGFVIFGFGTDKEEGPVRYLYKPTANALQMDPAYTFKYTHDIGTAVTAIRRKGAHVLSGSAKEYPMYITDPGAARATLQAVMRDAKSVGIYIDFIVRYPELLYSTLDVYKSQNPELWPINDEEKALLNT